MTREERQRRDEFARERDSLMPLLEKTYALTEAEVAELEAADPVTAKARLAEYVVPPAGWHPLADPTPFERENPHYHLLKVMRDPNYFAFTCRVLLGLDLELFQQVILKTLWTKPLPMLVASRGGSKSFMLGVYVLLRLLFDQGCRIAVVGASFRQSKVIYEYVERLWGDAPVLRDLVGSGRGVANRPNGPHRDVDRCDFVVGRSMASAYPVGHDGSKIRGQRANYIVADEFGSSSEEVFNNVVFGFASVPAHPVRNAREHRRARVMRAVGVWTPEDQAKLDGTEQVNQVVLAGTADYAFTHFAKTYRLYRDVLYSRGNPRRVAELFGGKVPNGFDWRRYAVLRLPASLLPRKFMDEGIIGAAEAKLTRAQFHREYCAIFPTDSDGFVRRSLIEQCVTGRPRSPVVVSGREVSFGPALRGDPGVSYVVGIDPASQQDRCAVVVVGMYGDHRRVVHCWSTNQKEFDLLRVRGAVAEAEYTHFVAGHVRDLMRRFRTARVLMDSQGGGYPLRDAFGSHHRPDEPPLYEVQAPPGTDPGPNDYKDGLHVLELVQFSRAEWVAEANHGLKYDLERQLLLFPHFDEGMEETALAADKAAGRVLIDESGREVHLESTLLDCVAEIEELKDELTTVVLTRTPGGRDRWDVPEVKLEGGKKGRMRKDRYSALLMANAGARRLMTAVTPEALTPVGGLARPRDPSRPPATPGYVNAPPWLRDVPPNLGLVRRRTDD